MSVRQASSAAAGTAALAGIALLAMAVGLAYFGMRALNDTLRVERLSLRLSAGIADLRVSVSEIDSLRREYLATGEPVLVARFDAERARVRQRLADLEARFEVPAQRASHRALTGAIEELFVAIEQSMRDGRGRGAEEAVRLALSPAQTAVAERVDRLLEELRARNDRIAAQRASKADEDLGFLERGVVVGILLAGALLGWSLRALFRQEAARRAAEAALHARSRELRLLIDAVPASIGYVDPAERVLLHNRAFAEWMGQPSARIVGRTVREVMGEAAYAVAAPYMRRALAGESVGYERQQHRGDGELRDLAVALVPHRAPSGGVLGYYALLTDVTEQKNLSRLKSEFVSMVSHEVRTPATAIRGALGMLAGGAAGTLPPAAERLVGVAAAGCEQLVRLVDDIADIEQVEAGAIPLELREEDLARLLPLAVVAAAPLAQKHGVRLQVRGDLPPARVQTDASRVGQVLANLLSNAIQFSPSGAVVQTDFEPRGPRFRVTVRDHGPGVSEAMRPRLFQKFAQDPAVARGATGRFGLGLAISKLLIERLGGSIGYEPASGGGALFWFELPRPGAGARGAST